MYNKRAFLFLREKEPPVFKNIGDFWRYPENQKLKLNNIILAKPYGGIPTHVKGLATTACNLKIKKERRIVKKDLEMLARTSYISKL